MISFFNLPQSLTPSNPHIEMSVGSFGNIGIFLVVSLFITTGILSISKLYLNLLEPSVLPYRIKHLLTRPLIWVGQHSISVLCLHGIFISLLIKFFSIDLFPFSYNLKAVIIALICLLLCFPVTAFINLYAPNLFGRS